MVTNSGYEKINIFTWYCVHVFGTRWLYCPILSFRQEGYFHFFCIFDWYYFTYVAWCNYVKVSGIMESTLPFQWMMICTLQRVLLRMKLFSPDYEDLNHMEYFYRKEVPELQSVVRVFLREREKVRKGWRLTKFPFSLLYWRPEAHKMEPHCDNALTAIQEGQQLTAIVYHQYASESKQHSHDFQAPSHAKTLYCVF